MNTILLLLDHQENRRLLAQHLETHYSVLLPPPPTQQADWLALAPGDLIIVDETTLRRCLTPLADRRQAEEPIFLPVLLIAPQSNQPAGLSDLWQHVDDQLQIPCSPIVLQQRIEVLLRTRRMSMRLQVANTELQAANDLKSRFVSIVSHEFRNSLNSISGFTQILEQKVVPQASEKVQVLFGRLQDAIAKSTQLTAELLVLGRTGSSRLQFKPQSLNLKALCQSQLEIARMGDQHQRQIALTITGDCTPAVMDGALLEHILSNLLSNALKYSPKAGPVQMSVVAQDAQVIFEVRDSGIGIPLADQQRLFQTFERASNVGRISGTGLGLAIVQECVTLHHGKISVSSQVGDGTTFTVTLPLVSASQPS